MNNNARPDGLIHLKPSDEIPLPSLILLATAPTPSHSPFLPYEKTK
jgi:hypothetical protein